MFASNQSHPLFGHDTRPNDLEDCTGQRSMMAIPSNPTLNDCRLSGILCQLPPEILLNIFSFFSQTDLQRWRGLLVLFPSAIQTVLLDPTLSSHAVSAQQWWSRQLFAQRSLNVSKSSDDHLFDEPSLWDSSSHSRLCPCPKNTETHRAQDHDTDRIHSAQNPKVRMSRPLNPSQNNKIPVYADEVGPFANRVRDHESETDEHHTINLSQRHAPMPLSISYRFRVYISEYAHLRKLSLSGVDWLSENDVIHLITSFRHSLQSLNISNTCFPTPTVIDTIVQCRRLEELYCSQFFPQFNNTLQHQQHHSTATNTVLDGPLLLRLRYCPRLRFINVSWCRGHRHRSGRIDGGVYLSDLLSLATVSSIHLIVGRYCMVSPECRNRLQDRVAKHEVDVAATDVSGVWRAVVRRSGTVVEWYQARHPVEPATTN
jgi:hypothetical protein